MNYVWRTGTTSSPPQHVGNVGDDATCASVLMGLNEAGWKTVFVGQLKDKFIAFANVEKAEAYIKRNVDEPFIQILNATEMVGYEALLEN